VEAGAALDMAEKRGDAGRQPVLRDRLAGLERQDARRPGCPADQPPAQDAEGGAGGAGRPRLGGEAREKVVRSRVTLSEYAAEWLPTLEGRLRPATVRSYRDHLRLHVEPKLGRRRLSSVSVDDVASLVADLQRSGKAAWTIRGVLTVVGRLMGSAARRGLVAQNPVAQLERSERPRVERTQFPLLDREAVGRLIASTPGRYRVLVAVSVLLGLRPGEALGLRWADVDVREGVIHIRHQLSRGGALVEPKTSSAKREIPMPRSLAGLLAEHRLASPYSGEKDFVFSSSAGTPLQVRNIGRRGPEPALTAAGIERLRWHDLRHVAASLLISEGAPVGYVSRMLGHASPAITLSIYAHVFARAEHDERTGERMEAAFGRCSGERRQARDRRPGADRLGSGHRPRPATSSRHLRSMTLWQLVYRLVAEGADSRPWCTATASVTADRGVPVTALRGFDSSA
jgi:integrase